MTVGMFETNKKLVLIGDSITDCGRTRDQPGSFRDGEGPYGLGNGYVNLINAIITSRTPELKLRIINKGIGGNTVRDLKERWQDDVLMMNPDYLSIKIGINDVWQRYEQFLTPELHINVNEYEDILTSLVEQTEPELKKLILISPYLIDNNLNNLMRKDMDELGVVVKKIAENNNAIFIDTQKAFDQYLEKNHYFSLASDQVHPNTIGHMIIAQAFLDAVGY